MNKKDSEILDDILNILNESHNLRETVKIISSKLNIDENKIFYLCHILESHSFVHVADFSKAEPEGEILVTLNKFGINKINIGGYKKDYELILIKQQKDNEDRTLNRKKLQWDIIKSKFWIFTQIITGIYVLIDILSNLFYDIGFWGILSRLFFSS